MAANTPRRLGSTLPSCSSSSIVEDGRRRSCPESQQLVPEPFQSIPAQELLKDIHCRKCGWIRKEGGSLKTCELHYNNYNVCNLKELSILIISKTNSEKFVMKYM